jgi:putative flippase GtrA
VREPIAGAASGREGTISGEQAAASDHAAGRLSSEGRTIGRALVASVAATLADGVVYQALLAVLPGHWSRVSAAGAVAGAITNCALQREWVFRSRRRPLAAQAALYAAGSALTWLALQAALWVLIEKLGLGERVAWPPAKAITWIAVSYPLSRLVVFSEERP